MERMSDITRGDRLQIMLTGEEVKALDDWRFSRRMPSRAAAVRELLKRGLAAEGFATASGGVPSKDYGVLGGDAKKAPAKSADGRGSRSRTQRTADRAPGERLSGD